MGVGMGMGVRACVRAEAVPSQLHHPPLRTFFPPSPGPYPSTGGWSLSDDHLLFVPLSPVSSPWLRVVACSPIIPPPLNLPIRPPTAPFVSRRRSRRRLSFTSFISFLPFYVGVPPGPAHPPPLPHPLTCLIVLCSASLRTSASCVFAVSLFPSSAPAPAVPCVYLSLSSVVVLRPVLDDSCICRSHLYTFPLRHFARSGRVVLSTRAVC